MRHEFGGPWPSTVRGLPTLVVAGTAHTALRRHKWGEPLGAHVSPTIPDVPVGELRYLGGAIHTIGVKRLPGDPGADGDTARLWRAGNRLELELPRASPAIVPQPAY